MAEAFQASVELPDDDPDVKAGKPLHGKNLWPENLPGFKEAVLDYHTTMTGFTALLARQAWNQVLARIDGFGQVPEQRTISQKIRAHSQHYIDREFSLARGL